jgi:hypothetical protein
MKTMLNHTLTQNVQSNYLLIKHTNSPIGINTKVRSEEHLHCNNSGNSMDNKYFKYTQMNDVDLPPIYSIRSENTLGLENDI